MSADHLIYKSGVAESNDDVTSSLSYPLVAETIAGQVMDYLKTPKKL